MRVFLRRGLTLAVGLTLAAAAVTVVAGGDDSKHLTALFPRAVSFYPGAQVKVLGVRIGTVEEVRVEGKHVRVEMSYDAGRDLPADVHAVIVPPSLLGDRFVQLTPPYTGGPALRDGAVLPTERTAVPVEIDETYSGLNDLATALGPQGANSEGALADLVSAIAANLKGNGDTLNDTIGEMSSAVDALAEASPDIAGTVTNLAGITKNLAGNDERIRALVTVLGDVSSELNGQRTGLRSAVRTLGAALDDLDGLLSRNRPALTAALRRLTKTTATLAARRAELAETLDVIPLGITNLYWVNFPQNWDRTSPSDVAPHARTGAMTARGDLIDALGLQLGHSVTGLCGQLPPEQQRELAALCSALRQSGGDLGGVLAGLPGGVSPEPSRSLGELLLGGRR